MLKETIKTSLSLGKRLASEGTTTFKSGFSKSRSFFRNTMNNSTVKLTLGTYIKTGKGMMQGATWLGGALYSGGRSTVSKLRVANNFRKKVGRGIGRTLSLGSPTIASIARKSTYAGILTLGSVSMIGVGMMRGATQQSRDIVFQRYLQDTRYSRNMMLNSRVGLASGSNSMLQYGSTTGLSNALSRSRHGR